MYPQRPIATEEYLRFEAFNALALGAQGIVYWSYAMQDPNDNGYYQSAVVDKNGNPGPSWNAVKQINKEIKARFPNKTIWLYSGHTLDWLKSKDDTKELLNTINVLVDGPFIEELKTTTIPFRGSKNQRILKKVENGFEIIPDEEFI